MEEKVTYRPEQNDKTTVLDGTIKGSGLLRSRWICLVIKVWTTVTQKNSFSGRNMGSRYAMDRIDRIPEFLKDRSPKL